MDGVHRIPVVPVNEHTGDSDRGYSFLYILIVPAVVAACFGGWQFFKHRTVAPEIVANRGAIADFSVSIDAPPTIMADEEARVTVTLTNTSIFKRTVGVGIIGDGVFEASGSRRILEIASKQTEIVSLPVTALSRGSWMVRVGLYDDGDKLIGTATRPLSVTPPSLRVRLDMGEKSAIRVPKNGRVYAIVRYEALSAISTATIRVTGNPDKVVTLKNLKSGQRGSFTIWSTVPEPIRGQLVHTAALGLSVRSTWTDADGLEHAVKYRPAADTVKVSAFARLHDSRGKRLSDGPIPLTAGVESKFWINLGLSRDTRDAVSVLVRATLAEGIEITGKNWINNKDKFSYDAETRTLVWQTRPLRKTDPNEPLVGFEIIMKPGLDTVGTLPIILSSITADRIPDALTERHDVETGSVTADFRFDALAASENAVRK